MTTTDDAILRSGRGQPTAGVVAIVAAVVLIVALVVLLRGDRSPVATPETPSPADSQSVVPSETVPELALDDDVIPSDASDVQRGPAAGTVGFVVPRPIAEVKNEIDQLLRDGGFALRQRDTLDDRVRAVYDGRDGTTLTASLAATADGATDVIMVLART